MQSFIGQGHCINVNIIYMLFYGKIKIAFVLPVIMIFISNKSILLNDLKDFYLLIFKGWNSPKLNILFSTGFYQFYLKWIKIKIKNNLNSFLFLSHSLLRHCTKYISV